jgi:putative alpha-1,2-mannosidase
MGNFPIFPQTGCAGDNINNCFFFKDERLTPRLNGSVEAHPGYFAITLNTSIRAEMTVTNHTALYRFTFPSSNSANRNQSLRYFPLILVGLDDLQNSRTDGLVEVNTSTGRLAGNASFYPSFGIGTYNLSFCIDFSGAELRKAGVFTAFGPQDLRQRRVKDDIPPKVPPDGAWAQFLPPTNNQLLVRVGVSFMNVTQACHNAESEIPSFDFENIRSAAEDAWREKLSVIKVNATGVSNAMQTLFRSGVYRSMISPQDYTGENPLWNSNEP